MLSFLREDLDRRIVAGQDLAVIEREAIDCAPVDEDRRAAMWLYAWARLESGGGAIRRETAGRPPQAARRP